MNFNGIAAACVSQHLHVLHLAFHPQFGHFLLFFLFPSISFYTILAVLFQAEGIKPDDFTWEAFQKFLDSLCLRPEIQSIFEERFVTLSPTYVGIFHYVCPHFWGCYILRIPTIAHNLYLSDHTVHFSLCSSGSKRKPFISLDQLMDFINRRQRDSRLNEVLYPPLKREQVRQIMEKYETNASQLERGQ